MLHRRQTEPATHPALPLLDDMERAFHHLDQVVEVMRDKIRHLGNGLCLVRPIAHALIEREGVLQVER